MVADENLQVTIKMDPQTCLDKQKELAEWFNKNLSIPFNLDTENKKLALPCFDLALEHHAAICGLCDSRLFGSMFALVRVEFEAMARGLWFYHVASGEEIKKFQKENLKLEFGYTIENIEKKLGVSQGLLSKIKTKQWKIFCSFTHTGHQALLRRTTNTHTGPINYSDRDIYAALRCAGLFAILSAVSLASMTENQELVNATMEISRNYNTI